MKKILIALISILAFTSCQKDEVGAPRPRFGSNPPYHNRELIINGGVMRVPNGVWVNNLVAQTGTVVQIKPYGCATIAIWEGDSVVELVNGSSECSATLVVSELGEFQITMQWQQSWAEWVVP